MSLECFDSYIKAGKKIDRSVVTIGNFDGLHLGHQQLIAATLAQAKKHNVSSVLLSFSPHPSKLLLAKPVLCLMTDEQKKQKLKKTGLDFAVFTDFTPEFAQMSPDIFIQEVLIKNLGAVAVIVGDNFKFGNQAAGTTEYLQKQLALQKVETEIVSAVEVEDKICSSSLIRTMLSQGDVSEAARFLGCPFQLQGKVVTGEKRGRELGFPTANIATEQELIPSSGVYFTTVEIAGNQKTFIGATNIGVRPTFADEQSIKIETHILDFANEIYGKVITLNFIKKIRDEVKFSSITDLQAQISQDIKQIRFETERENLFS
ncbi:MAG: bifunctional riboflavin kinase/FAD synthetase [bacterium]|nr:bifunctional riboflavin kinase/FAD synthetase [bacterium]